MLVGTAGYMCSDQQPQLRFQPTTGFHRLLPRLQVISAFNYQVTFNLCLPAVAPDTSRQSIPVLPVQIPDPRVSSKHNKWLFYNLIYIYWEDSHKFTFTNQVGEEKERPYWASHSVMRLALLWTLVSSSVFLLD